MQSTFRRCLTKQDTAKQSALTRRVQIKPSTALSEAAFLQPRKEHSAAQMRTACTPRSSPLCPFVAFPSFLSEQYWDFGSLWCRDSTGGVEVWELACSLPAPTYFRTLQEKERVLAVTHSSTRHAKHPRTMFLRGLYPRRCHRVYPHRFSI